MNVEQIEAELLDLFKRHGVGHAFVAFRDRQHLRTRSFAYSPIDEVIVKALADEITKRIDGARDAVTQAVRKFQKEHSCEDH